MPDSTAVSADKLTQKTDPARHGRPNKTTPAGPATPALSAAGNLAIQRLVVGDAPQTLVSSGVVSGVLQRDTPPGADPDTDDPDPDHPASKPDTPKPLSEDPEPDFIIMVHPLHPDQFLVPAEVTRRQIAKRLFGSEANENAFDLTPERTVHPRRLDSLTPEAARVIRTALDAELDRDAADAISTLKDWWVTESQGWELVTLTTRWSERSEYTRAEGDSYFDAYLQKLNSVSLRARGVFDHDTKTGLQWLLSETGNQSSIISELILRRSTALKGTAFAAIFHLADDVDSEPDNVVGRYQITEKDYPARLGAPPSMNVPVSRKDKLVDETTQARAEVMLRNQRSDKPRVLIPRGKHFYGYTVTTYRYDFAFNPDYKPGKDDMKVVGLWWNYPGSIYIPPGGFQAEFTKGGPEEAQARTDALTTATAKGLDAVLSLDFDSLSVATIDQRLSILRLALTQPELGEAQVGLVSRLLYSTPAADFKQLVAQMSTMSTGNDKTVMQLLASSSGMAGQMAVIGRVFTAKALESVPVLGNVASLDTFEVGYDDDDWYHYAWMDGVQVDPSAAGNEKFQSSDAPKDDKAAGAAPTKTGITLVTGKMKGGFFRELGGALFNREWYLKEGESHGPYLPTQLVKVNVIGKKPRTMIVTALEAGGLLSLLQSALVKEFVKPVEDAAMIQMATMGLARAFGPALAEGLASGGLRTALAEAAVSKAGTSAILDTVMLGGMAAVEHNREALAATPEGREFLSYYELAMGLMIAHDVSKLIATGVVPKLASLMDRVDGMITAGRERFLPFKQEIEALKRAVDRWKPLGADLALTPEGVLAMSPEQQQAFNVLLMESRGEVAAESLVGKLGSAGRATKSKAESIFDTLKRLASKDDRAATAQLAIARRASAMKAEAGDALLEKVYDIIRSRPGSAADMADLLTAAVESRNPNSYLQEVQKLANRKGLTSETLAVLGKKARAETVNLAWLNGTTIDDHTLNFLGSDSKTHWDEWMTAATDPKQANWKNVMSTLRGAGAELVAEQVVGKLGTNIKRQVQMGSSILDYELEIAGKAHGLEVKGWTPRRWDDAIDGAVQRANKKAMTAEQKRAVKMIDGLVEQLQDAKSAKGVPPLLALTDGLSETSIRRLQHILDAEGLTGVQIVKLPEAQIKNAAKHVIGEPLGVLDL